jgi:hypothetical protein
MEIIALVQYKYIDKMNSEYVTEIIKKISQTHTAAIIKGQHPHIY